MSLRRVLLLGAVVALSACGIKRVPNDVLERLPYESKIELLESENDVALAVDRLDEARAAVARARDQIRRAKDRASAAKSETRNATDAISKEVAELALIEADARVEWLRAQQALNVSEESLAEQNLTCAYARHEVSRLNLVRKAKLEGSEKLEPEKFAEQVTACEQKYAALKEKLKVSNEGATAARGTWETARAALAKKTFDARASPYVE